jgi:hypothetical protein
VWRDGNDAVEDDRCAFVPEGGDAEIGFFGFGGQVRGARCRAWGTEFPGKWDYSAGTKSRACWTYTPSNLPSTSPPESFRNIRLCGPGHILMAGDALHLTPKQAHVLREQYGHGLITEELCEKKLVRSTVFPQHRTSAWWLRHERNPPQVFFVFRYRQTDILHHCFFRKHTYAT